MRRSFMKSVLTACLMFAVFFTIKADIFEKNKMLGRGMNLGNTLEAPTEGAWGEALDTNYFKMIAEKGFQSVRIPIKWSTEERTAIDSPYIVNEIFFSRVDLAINSALKNHLNAIIDIHHYDTLFTNPSKEWIRFKAIWKQIAERYKDYSDSLYFEILNEPNTNLTPELWNNLLSETFTIIRETNKTRPVIIGVAEWGGVGALRKLVLPNDSNIILTVHYYEPFQFTHQGASWVTGSNKWVGNKWSGTYFQKLAIVNDFDYVRSFAQKNNVPIFMGEFGSGDVGDPESRYKWTSFCARLFEKYGFSWAYWSFGTTFAAYNSISKKWNDTIANALMSNDTSILSMNDTVPLVEGKNLVINGDFSQPLDTNIWKFGTWAGKGKGEIIDDEFKVTITDPGTASWAIQLLQTGMNLQKNHSYALLFDVRSDVERTISANISMADDPWSSYGYQDGIIISNQKKTVMIPVTMAVNDTNTRVCFSFGTDTNTVYLDNIQLIDLGLDTTAVKKNVVSSTKTTGSFMTKVNGKKIDITFKAKMIQPLSISVLNLNGRVMYKLDNVSIGASNKVTLPLQMRSSSPMILQIKGKSITECQFIQFN